MAYGILLIVLIAAIIWCCFGWLSSIIFIVLTIFAICFYSKYCDYRIKKIAKYIFNELKDVEKIKEAKKFISMYEMKLKKYKEEVNSSEEEYKKDFTNDSFWNFGRDGRLKKFKKNIEKTKTARDVYEIENKKQYEDCKYILNHVGNNFYDRNEIEINNQLKQLIRESLRKEKVENQKQLEIQEQLRKEQLELVKKQREENNKLIEQKSRGEKVAKSIRDMEDYIPVLKDHVVKNHSLDAHMLKQLRSLLNIIKKNIEFVNSKDYSNIEQLKLLVEDVFSKENSGNYDVEKKMVMDSLSNILEIVNIKKNDINPDMS